MNHFSIKDVEALTGIKPHTLRIWEQRYGILKPERTDTNIRYYSSDDLKRILNISLLMVGYTRTIFLPTQSTLTFFTCFPVHFY